MRGWCEKENAKVVAGNKYAIRRINLGLIFPRLLSGPTCHKLDQKMAYEKGKVVG